MSDKLSFNKTTTVLSASAPTGTAAIVKAANTARIALLVYNAHASVDCFIGPDATVTTATGIPVPHTTGVFVDDYSSGAWYGITSGSATDLRVIEISAP